MCQSTDLTRVNMRVCTCLHIHVIALTSHDKRRKAGRSKTSFAPDGNSRRSFVILLNGAKAWKRFSRVVIGTSSALRLHMSRASSRFHPVGSCKMSSTNFCPGWGEHCVVCHIPTSLRYAIKNMQVQRINLDCELAKLIVQHRK